MSSSTWKEHFKEKLAGLEEPREGSYLELALEEGRISDLEYIEWATQAHLMPVLGGTFFSEQNPDPQLLSKHALPWGPTLIPLAEWDGVLLVACLEKPQNFNGLVCFVLAEREPMQSWWNRLADNLEFLGPVSTSSAEMGLDLAPQETATPVNLSFSGVTLARPEDAPTPAAEETPAMPSEPVEAAAEPVTPVVDTAPAAPVPAASGAPAPQKAPTAPLKKPHTLGAELTPKKVDPTEKLAIQKFTKENPSVAANKSFADVAAHYPEAVLLLLNETGDALIPSAWTSSLKPDSDLQKIPTTHASMFRIVVTTEKPYHGFVVSNDINNQFFKQWRKSQKPEVATLVPIMHGEKIIGVLLGMTTQQKVGSQSPQDLIAMMEKASQSMAMAWGAPAQHAA